MDVTTKRSEHSTEDEERDTMGQLDIFVKELGIEGPLPHKPA